MHIIRQHQTSITLFERNGNVVVFRSRKEALKKLSYSWIASNVGPHFRILTDVVYVDYRYILRNDVGEIVTVFPCAPNLSTDIGRGYIGIGMGVDPCPALEEIGSLTTSETFVISMRNAPRSTLPTKVRALPELLAQ